MDPVPKANITASPAQWGLGIVPGGTHPGGKQYLSGGRTDPTKLKLVKQKKKHWSVMEWPGYIGMH